MAVILFEESDSAGLLEMMRFKILFSERQHLKWMPGARPLCFSRSSFTVLIKLHLKGAKLFRFFINLIHIIQYKWIQYK